MADDLDLPPGYENIRLDYKLEMAVPAAAAVAYRKVMHERDRRHDEAEREERRVQAEAQNATAKARLEAERQKAQAAEDANKPRFAERPEPGWHRVLPRLQELLDAASQQGIQIRSSDREVRERLELLQADLAKRGPDRRIGRPAAWRDALAGLERQLPHFREPIELIRNALALAEQASVPVRIPPMLLLGPPGVGKTFFSHQVAELLGTPHASIAFDQPSAGTQLRGSDRHWSNTESGILFNLICRNEYANPVVLLDELDKSRKGQSTELDPLAQLHGVLEPQTSRKLKDASTDIEFDASLVTYIATANSVWGLGLPLLSRFEVFAIGGPNPDEAVEVARGIAQSVLQRLGLEGRIELDRRCYYVLAHLSPRLIQREVEKQVAEAVSDDVTRISEERLWRSVFRGGLTNSLH